MTTSTSQPPGARPIPARPALLRPPRGRWVAGVAAGMAAHLGLDVRIVRAAFGVATLLGGVGALAYVFWWVTVPTGVPGREPGEPAWTRLSRPLAAATGGGEGGARRGIKVSDVVVALGLLAVAALLLASRMGERPAQGWVVPVLLLLAGAALAWSELDARRPANGNGANGNGANGNGAGGLTGRVRVARLAGGIAITATGVFLLVGQRAEPVVMFQSALAAIAVLAGVALVLAPWWLRLVRELGDARAERERESERADIAAHLHDSVLQTLALIRTRSTEPEVVRLARAQERDLRSWLYDDRAPAATSFAVQIKEVVAEIEDTRTHSDGSAPQIETVVVGDVVPTEETHAALQATREALLNAIAHGRPPVSVYLEASDDEVEVFVRDHGDGFDPDAVSQDRFGVRESILGRVRRRGGQASVREVPDGGTEVRIYLPRRRGGEGEE